MTLHQALLTATLHWLTVWINPQSGVHEHVSWCRPHCEQLAVQVVEDIELASLSSGVDPWLLLSLGMAESRLNPRALSSIGAFGLFQLHPRGSSGRLVLAACRHLNRRECDRLAALQGASLFQVGMSECGLPREAVYFHRTGRCGRGPNSDRVVRNAEKLKRVFLVQSSWTDVVLFDHDEEMHPLSG